MAAEPNRSPPIKLMRGPVRSMKKRPASAYRRDDVEDGEREAQLGIGYAEIRADECEQRREHQHVEALPNAKHTLATSLVWLARVAVRTSVAWSL